LLHFKNHAPLYKDHSQYIIKYQNKEQKRNRRERSSLLLIVIPKMTSTLCLAALLVMAIISSCVAKGYRTSFPLQHCNNFTCTFSILFSMTNNTVLWQYQVGLFPGLPLLSEYDMRRLPKLLHRVFVHAQVN
jgi:hypothetical protein